MIDGRTYYQILGVAEDAEAIVIRAAYKTLAQKYHPDKFIGDLTQAERKMSEINQAYETLSNAESRNTYDSWLDTHKKSDSEDKDGSHRNDEYDHEEASTSHKQTNADSPSRQRESIFAAKNGFLKKYGAGLSILLVVAIVGGAFIDRPLIPLFDLTTYKVTVKESFENPFVMSEKENFRVDLLRDEKLGYYRLRVNGIDYEESRFTSISKAYLLSKGSTISSYILKTHCGGNGCGPSFVMIDLLNELISPIPIEEGTFVIDAEGIRAIGRRGIDGIGDPVPANLVYLVTDWLKEKKANWVEQSISQPYYELIGKHPEEYFSNVKIRSAYLSHIGDSLFYDIRKRTQVAGGIEVVNGNLLVLNGCMPHSCFSDTAVTVINAKSGATYSVYQVDNNFFQVGDQIVDETINIDGFRWSAYEHVFNKHLSNFGIRTRVTPIGNLNIVKK